MGRIAAGAALLLALVGSAGAEEPTESAEPTEPMEPTAVWRPDGTMLLPSGMVRKLYDSNFVDDYVAQGKGPGRLTRLVQELRKWKSVQGSMRVLPDGRTVEIIERPENLRLIDRILGMLDKPLPQVYVQAKVIEIRYDSNLEFGVVGTIDRDEATDAPNTFFRRGEATLNPPSFLDSQTAGATPFQGATAIFKLLGDDVSDHGALDYLVRAVQEKGTAEILSQPAMIATENRPASIVTGERIPVPTVETHGTTTIVKTEFKQTGIELKITPLFIGREYVKMDVNPMVSTVRQFIDGGQGTRVPVIAKRQAATTVTVHDGETLIIGGLLSTSTIESRTQIPVLGDIPFLGHLFASQQTDDRKNELVFFITPHIIRPRGGGVPVSVVRPGE